MSKLFCAIIVHIHVVIELVISNHTEQYCPIEEHIGAAGGI